jgi:PAS domain S-box-containing protein
VAPPPALRLVSEGAGRPGAEGADRAGQASLVAALAEAQRQVQMQAGLLDKLPIGALVMREGRPLYANRTLLDLLGHADLAALAARAPDRLFAHRDAPRGAGGVFSLLRADGAPESVDARMSAITWNGEPATLMAFRRAAETADHARIDALELDLQRRDRSLAELASVLDIATDGVVTVDGLGRILSLNRTAEALFGYDQREVTGEHFTTLMAPESHVTALDYLDGLKGSGVAALMNDGREVQGRVRQGGRIPLFVTMGRIADGPEPRFCAVLRDMTAWKQAESELTEARRAAEAASAQKSDVLAKISHEIRTPLNAIIGFAEVMAEERFGPVGNERYRGYLKDIHESGGYVISLVNDLLDLAKIEAGKVDFNFTAVSLNDIATASVSLLQSEAQRQRVVLRSGLQPKLPQVVADERSIRQIVLNILSNAVKFTDAGGQVIVSTALSDRGEAILRVRDTGIGMTDKELASAMEPFRQVSNTRRGQGTGLGLPITRALVEANKGTLVMTSVKGEGTLVEVSFPPQRVLAS